MTTVRLPLAATQINTRNGSLSNDALLQNCLVEKIGDDAGVMKRDCITTTYTIPQGIPTGMWEFNGTTYFSTGYSSGGFYYHQIYKNPTSVSGVNLISVALGEQNYPLAAAYDPISNKFLFTTATKAYDAVSGVAITLPTVSGLAYGAAWLDGYFFIYGLDGNVYNSSLDDPRTWNALGAIKPNVDIGYPTHLTRYLNYIVTFGSTGYYAYYDAANAAPASPLSPVPNLTGKIGCASPYAVSLVANSIVWLGRDNSGSWGVYEMTGHQVQKISTAAVDRYLNKTRIQNCKSTFLQIGGHHGYYLSDYGLFYDADTQTWSYFTNNVARPATEGWAVWFSAGAYVYYAGISPNPGVVGTLSNSVYQEFALNVPVKIVTNEFDRSNNWKFMNEIDLISDKNVGTPSIRWTDNDFVSWSASYTFDTTDTRSNIYRLGRTRRRAFELTHSDNTPFRAFYLEIDYDFGER